MTFTVLVTSLLVVSSQAPRGARTPAAKLQAGQAEFNRGDLHDALRLLDSAAAESTDDELLSKIHLLRGQCFGAQQEFEKAQTAFALALERDPTLTLDPARVDPQLVKLLDGARARMDGELKVRTEKPGARVLLDGVAVGATPYRGSVTIGAHEVEVRDGKAVARERVVVHSKRTVELTPRLAEEASAGRTGGTDGTARAQADGAEATSITRARPFAELRTGANPVEFDRIGFELGAGLEAQYVRASLSFKLLQEFGITLRGAGSAPLDEHWRLFAELEVPLLFGGEFSFGLGGAGGAEYAFIHWVSAFLEVGGRHFFTGSRGDQVFLQLGARIRVPGLSL